jgi:hypothetical protein
MPFLPDELLEEIFQSLEIPFLLQLTRTCKRFSQIIRNPIFGSKYLKNHVKFIQLDVKLLLNIQWTDQFQLFTTHDAIIFHQWTLEKSTLCFIKIDDSGIPSFRSSFIQPPIKCSFQETSHPISISHDHKQSCSLCHRFHPKDLIYAIDKNYRVFMRDFRDFFRIPLGNGAVIHLSVEHDASIHDNLWNSEDEPKAYLRLYRYGLLESIELSKRLLSYFKMKND